jgi:hypothetical protein
MSFVDAETEGEVYGEWHQTHKKRKSSKKLVYTTQFDQGMSALEDMKEPPYVEPEGPISVPHDGPPAPAPIRYLSLPEINRDNFRSLHGIDIQPEDDVDLDHTSCDSGDEEKPKPSGGAGSFASARRMHECFLCRWGNTQADSTHMKRIRELILDNIGKIDTRFIALTVHKYYTEIVRPEALMMGRVLPKWRSKDIFVCIETHNFYPEIRLTRNLSDLTVIENGLLRQLFTEHGPDAKNIKLYTDIVKLGWTLRNTKMDALNFNTNGAVQLSKPATQPPGMRLARGVKRPHRSLLTKPK